jgi:hypothetical protein
MSVEMYQGLFRGRYAYHPVFSLFEAEAALAMGQARRARTMNALLLFKRRFTATDVKAHLRINPRRRSKAMGRGSIPPRRLRLSTNHPNHCKVGG